MPITQLAKLLAGRHRHNSHSKKMTCSPRILSLIAQNALKFCRNPVIAFPSKIPRFLQWKGGGKMSSIYKYPYMPVPFDQTAPQKSTQRLKFPSVKNHMKLQRDKRDDLRSYQMIKLLHTYQCKKWFRQSNPLSQPLGIVRVWLEMTGMPYRLYLWLALIYAKHQLKYRKMFVYR